jgi:dihydrofolate synthase/folylpolyglutamate synthase
MVDKDAGALAAELSRAGASVFVAALPSERAAPPAALATAMRAAGVDVANPVGTVADGLEWFRRRATGADRLLVTGSHVTVTEAIRAAALGENTQSDGPAKNHPRGRE